MRTGEQGPEIDALCCTHPNTSEIAGESVKLRVADLAPVVDPDHVHLRGIGALLRANPGTVIPPAASLPVTLLGTMYK